MSIKKVLLEKFSREGGRRTSTTRVYVMWCSSSYIRRMILGPPGNPPVDNILEIIKILQANEGVLLRVEAHKAAA